jgi:hypothetical protein
MLSYSHLVPDIYEVIWHECDIVWMALILQVYLNMYSIIWPWRGRTTLN